MTKCYLFYSDILNDIPYTGKSILLSKTNKSFLIGPIIDDNFDFISFKRRILSNSIYNADIYKPISIDKCIELIEKYKSKLKSNMVIEVFRNKTIEIHNILPVPGVKNEKE